MPFNHNKENSAYFHKGFSKKKYLYRQKWTARFAKTSKSLYFREMLSVFYQYFEELWQLLCLRYSITIQRTLQISRNVFQKLNIFRNKRAIQCLLGHQNSTFPEICRRFLINVLSNFGNLHASDIQSQYKTPFKFPETFFRNLIS